MECLKIENLIIAAKQEIQLLEVEEKAIDRQFEAMKKMGHNSFWPKPILHPNVEENSDRLIYIQIKPCEFCARGFHCNDIVVTSCRHTSHLFYLSKMLRDNNSCSICGQMLHLDQWHSFGFYDEDDDMRKRVDDMSLENQREAMKSSL